MIGAGRLTHRIEIQTATKIADGRGGNTTTWAKLADVWARVRPLAAQDAFFAQSVQQEVTSVVDLRFVSGVVTGCRVLFRDRTLNVVGVYDPGENRRELRLACKEA